MYFRRSDYMKKIIIALIFLIALLFLINIFSVKIAYKINWNINMPNPKKVESPINYVGGGDILAFDIMYYNKKDIEKILKKTQTVKINEEDIKIIQEKLNYFKSFLDEKQLEKLEDYFKEEILENNDYYILLEKKSSKGKMFDLLIIDSKNNIIYSFNTNF